MRFGQLGVECSLDVSVVGDVERLGLIGEPTASHAHRYYETLFARAEAVRDLPSDAGIVVGDPGAVVMNSDQITDLPAGLISGDGAKLINLAGGSFAKSAETSNIPTSAALVITGADVVVENRSGAFITATNGSFQAILGSDYDDTVINDGVVQGYVRLGGGADRYQELVWESNALGGRTVDLGDGDDEALFDLSRQPSTANISAIGGQGTDSLRMFNIGAGAGQDIRFNGVSGVENIEFTGAGAGSRARFTRWSAGLDLIKVDGGLELLLSSSSGASYTGAAGGTIMLEGTALRVQRNTVPERIIGGDGSERVVMEPQLLPPSILPTAIGLVSLGGGNDSFLLHYGYRNPLIADGGAGYDTLEVNQFDAVQGLASFSGFERVNHGLAIDQSSRSFTLRDIGADAQVLMLDVNNIARESTLTLDLGDRSGLTVGAGFNRMIVAEGAILGALIDRHAIDASWTISDQQIENRGTILGAVNLLGGDDQFVNTGSIEGGVSLGDGKDRFADTASSTFRGDVRGGAGDDYYVVTAGYSPVEVANEGVDTIETSGSWTLADNFEHLVLTGSAPVNGFGNAADNLILGNDGENYIVGGSGNDVLRGGSGNDTLDGGDGNDDLDGGAGDDVLHGDGGDDLLSVTEGGRDQLYGGEGNDRLTVALNAGTGTDNILLDGGAGNDLFTLERASGLYGVTALGGTGDDHFVIKGGLGTVLTGGAGRDTFTLGDGWPTTITDFEAGAGGDVIDLSLVPYVTATFLSGGMTFIEKAGATVLQTNLDGNPRDFAILKGVNVFALTAENLGGLTPYVVTAGTAANDMLTGTVANDRITGGAGADLITGGVGADLALYSGAGDGYAFRAEADGWSVIDTNAANGNDGTDRLVGMEAALFADQTIRFEAAPILAEALIGPTDGHASGPTVTADGVGGYLLSWSSLSSDGIFFQSFDGNGAALGGPVKAFDTVAFSLTRAAYFQDGSFVLTALTTDGPGAGDGIIGRLFNADGSAKGPSFHINITIDGTQTNQQVAVTQDGGFVVSWQSEGSIIAQRFNGAGVALGGEIHVSADGTTNSGADVTALRGGGFAVVWNSGEDLLFQRYDAAGHPAGGAAKLNAAPADIYGGRSVAELADGHVVVTWSSPPGGPSAVMGRIVGQDGAPTASEFRVSSEAGSVAPDVAALGDGGFVVVYEASDRSTQAQRFTAAGQQVGNEMRLSEGPYQPAPSVAALADGRFVAAWDDNEAGQPFGSLHKVGVGIYGQPGFHGDAGDNVIRLAGSTPATLSGDAGTDQLFGSAGKDLLLGGAGNDVLAGGLGEDTLVGGADRDTFKGSRAELAGDIIADFSADDRIVFADADLAGFSFARSGNTLTFGAGQSLTLAGFSGHLSAQAAAEGGVELMLGHAVRNDINGDGRADILWRNDSGALTNWLGTPDGGFEANDAIALIYGIPTSWKVAGVGDFNGDGRNDILWRNASGALTDWLGQANGDFVANDSIALIYDIPTSWKVAGVGDFNGDGRFDILWRNDSGALTNWLGQANGGFVANDSVALIYDIPTSWKVAGVGDFNGDGRNDILWRNASGALTDWLGQANGGFVANDSVALIYGIPTSWKVAGVGDFNGDGREDILWRNDSGALTNWLGQANGGFVANDSVALIYDIPTYWKVAGVQDFNGDGRADILWRNDSGALTDWLGQANGGFIANDAVALDYSISRSWHTQLQAFDPA